MSASQYILESPRPCQGVGVTSQTSDLKKLKPQPSQAYAKPVGVSHFTDSCLLFAEYKFKREQEARSARRGSLPVQPKPTRCGRLKRSRARMRSCIPMPLKLCKRIAMALQSDSMQFTTLVQNKCSISLSTLYPNCATEQLHGPAQLSLKSCIPLMTVLFHRGASLDRTVSSLISPLHSRALQQFSLAIQSPLRDSKDRVVRGYAKQTKKDWPAWQC